MITKSGVVTKISGNKTIKVEVNEYRSHQKYKKRYRITRNFLVHDETGDTKIGSKVTIQQHRPISKRKSWILVAEPEKK